MRYPEPPVITRPPKIDIDKPIVPNFKRSYAKTGLVVTVLSIVIVLFNLSVVQEHLNPDVLRQFVSNTGLWAPLIFLALASTLMFVGAPRTVFYLVGGAAFGVIWGLAISQLAALVGSLGPFLFARWGARDWVTARLRPFKPARIYLENPTSLNVFMIRHLPIPGVFINMFLGSSSVRLRPFLLGSFFGFIPQGVIFILIGSGIGEPSMLSVISRIWAALLVLVLTFVIVRRITDRTSRNET